MSRSISQPDRDERAQALKTIYDGLRMALEGAYQYQLACIRLDDQANSRAGAVEIAPAQGEKLLTLSELAARMGRDPRTIQEWEKDFGLPSLRAHPNADPLFDWREVLEWMRRHRDHKNDYIEGWGNGKIASAPIGTRPQATQRRS